MSIHKLPNGKYRVRVYNPHGAEYRKVVATKQAALAHEAEVRVQMSGGWNPGAGSIRFDTYTEQVLAARPLSPNSRRTYGNAVRLHIDPVLGHHRLDRIRHTQLQSFLSGLTESQARTCKRVLNIVFDSASRDGLITTNPTAGLRLPPSRVKDVAVPTWEAVRAADELVQVAAATGMRAGELMGLSVDDIDVDELVVRVRRQRLFVSGFGKHYGPPKTINSERDIPVPMEVIEMLERVTPKKVELPWRDGPTEVHELFFPGDVSKAIYRRIGFSAHKLRHLYTRLLETSMIPVTTIDEVLGHSGSQRSLSIRVYSSAGRSGREAVRQRLSAVLQGHDVPPE